jgi:hypothetical protein
VGCLDLPPSSAIAWYPAMSRQRHMGTHLSPGINAQQYFTGPVLLAASNCVQAVRNSSFKLLKLRRLMLKVLMRFRMKEASRVGPGASQVKVEC